MQGKRSWDESISVGECRDDMTDAVMACRDADTSQEHVRELVGYQLISDDIMSADKLHQYHSKLKLYNT